MTSAIEAKSLVKRYASGLTAVDGISFQVREGICFGILGPNGAGKTTTIRMSYGFIPPTAGDILVLGRSITAEPRAVKASLGVCPQEDNLDPDFPPREGLAAYGRFFGMAPDDCLRRADELLDFVGMADKAQAQVRELSGGMKRRLAFARALIHRPRVLVLDEPTTGLDPQARHLVWDKVRELKRAGVTVLLTTHYMEEAAGLCDEILLMDAGRIVERGSPRELVRRHLGEEPVEAQDPSGLAYRRPPNLEDLFLKRTGRELRG